LKFPESYDGISSLVGALTAFYDNAGYRETDAKKPLPPFLQTAIGPPLLELHSYNIPTGRTEVSKSAGFGKALNVAHQEMANMGFRLASFIYPDILARVEPGKVIAEYKRIPFKGIDVSVKGADKPLHLDQKLAQDMLLLGAISQGFQVRPSEERDLIDHDIGNADVVAGTMRGIFSGFAHAVATQGLRDHVNFDDFRLDTPKIRTAFLERAQELQDARVFIQIAQYGILTDGVRDLCWNADIGEKYPEKAKEIAIYNPMDAACALACLGRFAKPEISDELRASAGDLSDRLAHAQTHEDAARLLRLKEFRDTISQLRDHIPNDARGGLLHSAIIQLQEYRERHPKPILNSDRLRTPNPLDLGEGEKKRSDPDGRTQVGV